MDQPPWPALLLTLGLYVVAMGSFLLLTGLTTVNTVLLVGAISALLIGFFFFRSLYQAIRMDSAYWWVVSLHMICLGLLVVFFMS